VPIPSVPILLAAGALAHMGKLNLALAVVSCLAGALIADTFWLQVGRQRGRAVLSLLCRMSLEPESCVRRTEDKFVKYGLKSLLISKFVPGLNTVAAPLAGISGVSAARFAAFDIAGTLVWVGCYVGAGYLFTAQLETVLGYLSRMGSGIALLIALFAIWILWKMFDRQRFLNKLAVRRITVEDLRERLNSGEEFFVVDLRSDLDERPSGIPGAIRISAEQLKERHNQIPRDREIILFCS
jgi:membrane protein DedA with SNARE-associated domain